MNTPRSPAQRRTSPVPTAAPAVETVSRTALSALSWLRSRRSSRKSSRNHRRRPQPRPRSDRLHAVCGIVDVLKGIPEWCSDTWNERESRLDHKRSLGREYHLCYRWEFPKWKEYNHEMHYRPVLFIVYGNTFQSQKFSCLLWCRLEYSRLSSVLSSKYSNY